MALARKLQINLEATRYYHCVSRCVRRAYLCGVDVTSGRSYEHRRSWVQQKLLQLPNTFAIDVCAFAVMSNHTHSVLYVNHQLAQNWTAQEVLTRWHRLFKGTTLTRRYAKYLDENMTGDQLRTVLNTAEVYRTRLTSISWFMRSLNEYIARKANEEDDCTGRFWEGRFKCHALLDEQALLCCMVYVDTNPIRAKLCSSIEQSNYTSVKLRLDAVNDGKELKCLKSFNLKGKSELEFSDRAYIELVEARVSVELNRSLGDDVFHQFSSILGPAASEFEKYFHGPVGNVKSLTQFSQILGVKRRTDLSINRKFFGETNADSVRLLAGL